MSADETRAANLGPLPKVEDAVGECIHCVRLRAERDELREMLKKQAHWRNSWEKGGNRILKAEVERLRAERDELKEGVAFLYERGMLTPFHGGSTCRACGGEYPEHAPDCCYAALCELAGVDRG